MGHYRSEMVSDEEDRKNEDHRQVRRTRIAANIKKAIEEEGIEYVLADILLDPLMTKLGFDR